MSNDCMNECSVSADASGNFLFTISHFDPNTAAEVIHPFRNLSFINFDSNCAKKNSFYFICIGFELTLSSAVLSVTTKGATPKCEKPQISIVI